MSESKKAEPQKVLPIEEIEEIVQQQRVVWFNGLGFCEMFTLLQELKKAARYPWEPKP